jgi:heme-degrading monooxygenase HmoA
VTLNKQDERQFLVIWEFIIRPGKGELFEQIYGPGGDWVQLFRKGRGYGETRLVRGFDQPLRYLTLDFWESREDYETFKSRHADEYKTIDARCEALTETERELGKFLVSKAEAGRIHPD